MTHKPALPDTHWVRVLRKNTTTLLIKKHTGKDYKSMKIVAKELKRNFLFFRILMN